MRPSGCCPSRTYKGLCRPFPPNHPTNPTVCTPAQGNHRDHWAEPVQLPAQTRCVSLSILYCSDAACTRQLVFVGVEAFEESQEMLERAKKQADKKK